MSRRKDIRKEALGNNVGLVLEPMQARDHEEDGGEVRNDTNEQNAAPRAEQPQGGGNQNQDAEPRNLASRAEDGVGDDTKA